MTMPMSTQVLSCETWEIFEITYFEKHLWTTASVGVAILSNGNTTYGTKHLQNKNDQLQCFFERALLLYHGISCYQYVCYGECFLFLH